MHNTSEEKIVVKRTEAAKFEPVVVGKGVFPAEIVAIRDIIVQERPTLAFDFRITGGPEAGKIVGGLTSKVLSEKSKLYSWIESIDKLFLPKVGEPLDVTLLVGKKCRILTDDKERTDKVGKPFKQSYVKEVISSE